MRQAEYDDILPYYNSELTFLRRMGRSFAARHPKIAGRLELSADHCADPHVERLIESFAFLTARIQRQIDSQFPEITTALLGVLYPNLATPVPPMAIAQFTVDPDQGKLTTGYEIPRETPLFAQSPGGLTCRFRTCYPVTLWPLFVTRCELVPASNYGFLDRLAQVAAVLHIRLEARGIPLSELALRKLRFYINGDPTLVNSLYELLFLSTYRVVLAGEDGSEPIFLPSSALSQAGFGPEERVIPCPPHALPAYRLLQEYFLLPEKFRFFDLDHLDRRPSAKALDILVLLDHFPKDKMAVDSRTFCLGCTPIINLFPKITEPIRLDHRQHEYRLEADMRRERTTEIHSILSVSSTANVTIESTRLEPFYSFRHVTDGRPARSFWHARRVPSLRPDMPGTDIMLSFVDLDFNPSLPPEQVVYAHVLCTNRDFAVQLHAGSLLQIEDKAPLSHIACLTKPTLTAYPPLGGTALWYLISNLSLNYLSLSSGSESLQALREMLRLYSFSDDPVSYQQIQGIREMNCRQVTRRIGSDAWRGFCRGTEVTLVVDENLYVGSGAFLLGSVLNQFFALYASINSFTPLVLKSQQRDGEWKRWAPLAGYQAVL
jgi:type VI secretion system protein ImpG